MPDPSLAAYAGIPGCTLLWIAAVIAFALFGRRLFYLVHALWRARGERRWDHPFARLRVFAVGVLGQQRLFNERAIGGAHFVIFWAFVFYAVAFFWNLLRGLVPIAPIPYADDVGWMALALEMLGVAAVAGLGVAAVRRYVYKPDRLEQSRDAGLILGLIATLLVSCLVGSGARSAALAAGGHPASPWTPVGNALGIALAGAGLTRAGAEALYLAMWWVHVLTVLAFLAYLPYSKHLHLLASPFGVLFASLTRGTLPGGTTGATRLEEFTWRQLLSGLSCAECGRCDRACPAVASGSALSPKQVVHWVKTLVIDSIPPLPLPRFAGVARAVPVVGVTMTDGGVPVGSGTRNVKEPTGAGATGHEAGPPLPAAGEIWGCTTCLSCAEQCPVFNEHVPLLVEMRRHLVSQGEVDAHVQDALLSLSRHGNSFGLPARSRTKWTQGLGFTVKDARKAPVEYLWFVGDYASYDPRLHAVTRTTAKLLRYAGLDFGTLGDGEQNAGNDARRVGEEGLFEVLRDRNLKALSKAEYSAIVTSDPHTYHALKNEYGLAPRVPVLHLTELLASLFRAGRLPVARTIVSIVTYHDPCYLGRYNGVYDAPRRVLAGLGVIAVEMPRSRAAAFCCGAGGGRIWMEDTAGRHERPAEMRVREAGALPHVHYLVTACPKDLVMFQDALKTTGLESRLRAVDLVDLVAQAVLPTGPLIEW